MNCPQCGQPIDNGAAFCGNCGLAMPTVPVPTAPAPPAAAQGYTAMTIGVGGQTFSTVPAPSAPIAQVFNNQMPATPPPLYGALPMSPSPGGAVGLPSYAIGVPHHTSTKLVLALVFGIIGIVGALLMAILGIVLGITGIIMATTAPRSTHSKLKLAGLVLSSLAIVAGLAVMAAAIAHDPKLRSDLTSTSAGSSSSGLAGTNTPCYSFSFISKLNVDNNSKTCSLNAYNANSLATSSEIYKVLSSTAPTLNQANFATISKDAIEQDVHQSLPGFSITTEHSGHFAGSPAYTVNATDSATNVAIQETTVLHATAQGDNLFVLIHATTGSKTDLGELEADWLWK